MAEQPCFDLSDAHRYFSANCFNRAWDLIDKEDRTPEEDEQMLRLAEASMFHWSQRPDCTAKNWSIGYWQISRIYAILAQPENALRYAHLSLEHTPENEPFLLGYAFEALARGQLLTSQPEDAAQWLREAWKWANQVTDEQSKEMLTKDLRDLQPDSQSEVGC